MKPKNTILVIDDEPATLKVMEANLRREGFEVLTVIDGIAGLDIMRKESVDTVIVDYMMPNLTGIEVLQQMAECGLDIPAIVITAHGSIEHAVAAMQAGAATYLTKPVNYDELLIVIGKCLEQRQLRQEVQRLRKEVSARYSFSNLIGASSAMQEIYTLIEDVARTDATVLIQGETGTGKELIARAIHYNSARRTKPFVGLSCAAIPETLLESELFGFERGAFTGAHRTHIGRFEQAHGGTLFLDEVGDMPLHTQAKLLRVLQERTFERLGGNDSITANVRLISATNKDLRKATQRGDFREDLYYRLNVVAIDVPPLRDRGEDIPLLAFHFVKFYASRFEKQIEGIETDALSRLQGYHWPGNVRQLENVIERAVIMEKSPAITNKTLARCMPQHDEAGSFHYTLYDNLPFQKAKRDLLDRFEREYIKRLLTRHNGKIVDAAKEAQMDYKNFCEKMKRHGLSKWDFKE